MGRWRWGSTPILPCAPAERFQALPFCPWALRATTRRESAYCEDELGLYCKICSCRFVYLYFFMLCQSSPWLSTLNMLGTSDTRDCAFASRCRTATLKLVLGCAPRRTPATAQALAA